MMNIFNKKPKNEAQYDDSYDNDFYRGPEDDENVVGEEDDNDLIPPMHAAAPKKSAPAGSGTWKVLTPHNAQDGLIIADYLINGCTVVMNIEKIDRETTVRLLDFLMGTATPPSSNITRTTSVPSTRRSSSSSTISICS